jgi:transcriptional regulator with XRE-family HTH domain
MEAESDAWSVPFNSVGALIRHQRNLANLSLRDLAHLTSVSNAYLSQIERGLHEPSVRVLTSVARALNVSAETLLAQAGLLDADEPAATKPKSTGALDTEAAILVDPRLSDAQRKALLAVYRSFLTEAPPADPKPPLATPATQTRRKRDTSRARVRDEEEPT